MGPTIQRPCGGSKSDLLPRKFFVFFFVHMTEWGPASNVISRLTFWHQCSTHIRARYKLSLGMCWWWGLTYSTEYRNRLEIVSWQTLWHRNISYPCPKNRYNIALWWNLRFTPVVVICVSSTFNITALWLHFWCPPFLEKCLLSPSQQWNLLNPRDPWVSQWM